MKKLLRNEKGFTLVELMVVIAIIGILAAVLIPKMSFLKDTAKEAGLDSNMRIVEATVTSMLPKYTTADISGGTAGKLDYDLQQKLNGNLSNPFSNVTTADIGGGGTTGQPAVVVYNGGYSAWNSTYPNIAGAMICALSTSNGHIKAEIGYLDKNGKPLASSKTKVVE